MTPAAPIRAPRSGAWMTGLILLYALMSLLSLFLAGRPGQIATLWFANPVGMVALLALQRGQWPVMLAGLGLANLLTNVVFLLPSQGVDFAAWRSAAAFVPGNCAEMLLGALALSAVGIKPADIQSPFRLPALYLLGALLPALLGAVAGATLIAQAGEFGRAWITWLAGTLIGNVAVLPLALVVWLQGWQHLKHSLAKPEHLALLLFSVGVTIVVASTFTHPFTFISMTLALLAAIGGLALACVATLMVSVVLAVFIGSGILLLPPSANWWADSFFYGAILATLLPGVFLAATVDSRKEMLLRLSESEERFRALYTQTPAMLHSMNSEGRIIEVSQQWLSTLGYSKDSVQGRPITDFLTPDSGQVFSEWADSRRPWTGSSTLKNLKMVKADGDEIDVVISAIWELGRQGEVVRQLAVVEDVTERRRLAEISHFAEHDALTGLPNRVLLNDRLERLCAHHQRNGGKFAVAFLDLDHFKNINDTHGHEAGDLLLKTVAERLLATLRTSDTVSRLGGDEFVLLVSAVEDRASVKSLASKVLEQVAQPCTLGNAPDAPVVQVGCSLGLAIYPDHGRDAATLLLRADQAMYVAKRNGRNRWTLF